MNAIFGMKSRALLWALAIGLAPVLPASQTQAATMVAAMGDSIGEGVQAGDAAWQTQVFSYLNLVNFMMAGDLSLPYIGSHLFGVVGNTDGRSRLDNNLVASNVAVSGATVNSLLNELPNATSAAAIDTEAELVLFPRQQTQMQYIEAQAPAMIFCWIGNNDVLSSVLAFGNMNASQLTPVANFEQDYIELANRLGALVNNQGSKVVFANIPDVTDIGFLMDRATAERVTGFAVALPEGSYTSVLGVLLMKLVGNDALMADPNFVLDSTELATIQSRVVDFNLIIQREADRIGMPVVDINTRFRELTNTPPVFFGRQVTNDFLGGLFSLDGVHPSNLGHAMVANEFISTMNQAFAMNVPQLPQQTLEYLFLTEPAYDKDGDGRISGRPGVGLLETLALIFGVSGDVDDLTPD